MAANREFVRLPSKWILEHGLYSFPWRNGGAGSDNVAALMALTVIAHKAEDETGIARVTYDQFCDLTFLSRAKVSSGLDVLEKIEVVERQPDDARSTFQLANYSVSGGWAKLPFKSMYAFGSIAAFKDFRLRKPAELDALKLFFLLVAMRNNKANVALIGYDKIELYTAIPRNRIKTAISFLASLSLIYVEHLPSRESEHGTANAYRIVGISPYNHVGTRGRTVEDAAFAGVEEPPTRALQVFGCILVDDFEPNSPI